MGDSEAALLVSFYLSAAAPSLTLAFSSLWSLVKLQSTASEASVSSEGSRECKL